MATTYQLRNRIVPPSPAPHLPVCRLSSIVESEDEEGGEDEVEEEIEEPRDVMQGQRKRIVSTYSPPLAQHRPQIDEPARTHDSHLDRPNLPLRIFIPTLSLTP